MLSRVYQVNLLCCVMKPPHHPVVIGGIPENDVDVDVEAELIHIALCHENFETQIRCSL